MLTSTLAAAADSEGATSQERLITMILFVALIGLTIGITMALLGVTMGLALLIPGLVLTVWVIVRWIADTRRDIAALPVHHEGEHH